MTFNDILLLCHAVNWMIFVNCGKFGATAANHWPRVAQAKTHCSHCCATATMSAHMSIRNHGLRSYFTPVKSGQHYSLNKWCIKQVMQASKKATNQRTRRHCTKTGLSLGLILKISSIYQKMFTFFIMQIYHAVRNPATAGNNVLRWRISLQKTVYISPDRYLQ